MSTKIFVNLPVKELSRSVEFFTKLGYTFNPEFTNENATCMIVSDQIFVMLLVEKFLKTFIPNAMAIAPQTTESIICLSVDSRHTVDELVQKALEAGGSTFKEPQDHGFMYGHGYVDLDGHIWEVFYMPEPGKGQDNS